MDTLDIAIAKSYTNKSLQGAGAVKGQKGDPGKDGIDGFSPTITENISNQEDYYRLDISNKDGVFTTPNLMGVIGIEYKNKSVGTPVGEIISYMGTIAPPNYLICDGTVYQIADYPILAQHFADNFGSKNYFGGDGETTFAVPDLRGEFLKGTNADEIPGIHQDEGLPNITGEILDILSQGTTGVFSKEPGNYKVSASTSSSSSAWFSKITLNAKNKNSIYGNSEHVTPNNTSVIYCIKYKSTYWITPTNETSNYNKLNNLPKINGITLTENLTLEDLGIVNSVNNALKNGDLNISADFLTESGFGNLRYYNGSFQYYNKTTNTWIDTSVTSDNVYVFNMIPQSMKHICGIYDVEKTHYKLMFEEPSDTVIDGQVACVVEKVIIRRKLGEEPINENDGIFVETIMRSDFGKYKDKWYVDESFTPIMNDIWYYKAFPISTTNFTNIQSDNSTGGIKAKDHYLFGFKIDQNESDPASMVTYVEDNKKFKKAYMDYIKDQFNYGSWKDSFIMPRQCMLYTEGTVAYYLNPDDYTLKIDGTTSDVTNVDFDGNAMNEWGKIFWKVVDNEDGTGTFYFSNKNIDEGFHCWSNINSNGDEIPYFYTPIYNGSVIDGKLRSLSGLSPLVNQTRQVELNYAWMNNSEEKHIYDTEVFADIKLFELLCILISGTTDSQTAFGSGNNNSYINTLNTGVKNTGTMDKKGIFWGNQDNITGVKVFGMEHPWGNVWRNCAGWINDTGTQKIKMTYGRSDGSNTDGYNVTGTGYITMADTMLIGTNGSYLNLCNFNEYGLIPKQAGGSASTYYTDGLWFNNNQNNYVLVGGASNIGFLVGMLSSNLHSIASHSDCTFGASISCKPFMPTEGGSI